MGLSALQWMPYAKDLYIYNKGDLAVVPDYLIAALYQRVGDLVDSFEETRNFDPDAPVTITSGQFLGMKQFLIPNYLEVNGSVF
ncbi:MAG: hypothetical protein HPY59_17350 [Anaerolineae bacterium]|nr:hypothetical protein [Anaerolineae bacterium]